MPREREQHGERKTLQGRHLPADGRRRHGRRDAALLARLEAACAALGRDPASLTRIGMVPVDHTGAEIDPGARRPPVQGTPEEMAAAFRSLAAEGISHLVVANEPDSLEGLEALALVLDALDAGD